MKLFFRLFIAIIFTWTPCLGQQRVPKLQGHVINAASGRAVEGVMVTVQRFSSRPDESLDRILGYGITGEDGSFSIILQDCPDSLRITASSLMTRKAEVVISSDEAPVTIKVEEEIQRLMEVKVKSCQAFKCWIPAKSCIRERKSTSFILRDLTCYRGVME